MKLVRIFFVVFITVALAIFLYSWYRLHNSMSAPSDPTKNTPATYGLAYETKHFKTGDNISLSGWYIPAKNPKALIIMIHGYKDTKATILNHAPYLHKAGYATFFIDLRSDKKNINYTLGVQEWKDIEAAYDYLTSLPEHKNKKTGFYSGSMGAAATIVAAGKTRKGDFLVTSVPYANFSRLFAYQIRMEKLPQPLLPFLRLAGVAELGLDYDNYAPDRHIRDITKPIFLMSATYDDTVNPKDAKYLFDLANEPKYFWQADTNHVIFDEKPEEFKKRVLKFLDAYTTPNK